MKISAIKCLLLFGVLAMALSYDINDATDPAKLSQYKCKISDRSAQVCPQYLVQGCVCLKTGECDNKQANKCQQCQDLSIALVAEGTNCQLLLGVEPEPTTTEVPETTVVPPTTTVPTTTVVPTQPSTTTVVPTQPSTTTVVPTQPSTTTVVPTTVIPTVTPTVIPVPVNNQTESEETNEEQQEETSENTNSTNSTNYTNATNVTNSTNPESSEESTEENSENKNSTEESSENKNSTQTEESSENKAEEQSEKIADNSGNNATENTETETQPIPSESSTIPGGDIIVIYDDGSKGAIPETENTNGNTENVIVDIEGEKTNTIPSEGETGAIIIDIDGINPYQIYDGAKNFIDGNFGQGDLFQSYNNRQKKSLRGIRGYDVNMQQPQLASAQYLYNIVPQGAVICETLDRSLLSDRRANIDPGCVYYKDGTVQFLQSNLFSACNNELVAGVHHNVACLNPNAGAFRMKGMNYNDAQNVEYNNVENVEYNNNVQGMNYNFQQMY